MSGGDTFFSSTFPVPFLCGQFFDRPRRFGARPLLDIPGFTWALLLLLIRPPAGLVLLENPSQ